VLLAAWITRQLVLNGVVTGLTIGLVAMGIVLVYRSTRVINFAVGNLGLPGAVLFALMVLNYSFPFWIALALAMVVGTLAGTLTDLIVVRRLFTRPRVTLLIATVGVAELMRAIVASYPDIDSTGSRYPVVASTHWESTTLGLRLDGSQLAILVVVPVVAVALGLALNRTTFGKAVAASADNPTLARLSAVNPRTVSTFVWAIAGFLSTLSIILLGMHGGNAAGIVNLGPITLARALAAATVAGMRSFPRAMVAGVAIGVVEAVVRFNFVAETGLIEFILFLAVLVAVYLQSRTSREETIFDFVPRNTRVPERLKDIWWVKALPRLTFSVGVAAALVLPLIVSLSSRHLLYSSILGFAICAMSVTVITGWSGQLSLSQMAFAGIGALSAAALSRGVELDIGWRDTRFIDVEAGGVPFVLAIVLASLISAAIAAIIGIGALRVRGLMLAVSTFAFAIASSQYLYRRPVFSGGDPSVVSFRRGDLFGIDLASQRTYYYFSLAGFLLVFAVVSRLRRSGVGRAAIAVRDNPNAAAAYTIGPARTELASFALAGGIAGFGGALLGGLVQNIRFTENLFRVEDSLRVVGMAVIGGLGAVSGPILGALWVEGLPAFFGDNELVPLFTSSIGLLFLIMYFPGGLVQILFAARDGMLRWYEARLPEEGPTRLANDPPSSLTRRGGSGPDPPDVFLHTEGTTVRFGGNLAVDDVTVTVGRNEIVGLIGTNGAGKSTLMNAIGGFVPAAGTVELFGRDVTSLSAPRRARLGLGRTFQAATLFPELTVTETVQVALEARSHTPLLATASHLPHTFSEERRKRAEAAELIGWLGLGPYSDHYVSDLSTGTRRIVELAGLLALDAPMLCLDEPTAGIAQSETEAFGYLLLRVRDELAAGVLIIGHDMALIMSVSDRVYCLERGAVIAEGPPSEIRRDPDVIASYLGTGTVPLT
jgi:ABC-type branched-subunit amino acid transport system ATPase component/ABC-type branched-subunit amino acid transport system permease subunit